MKPEIDYSLYLVTDSELMTTATVEESVELALLGGVTAVQLREKTASSREFYNTALRVREITRKHGVPLIINDRLDIAIAVNADGAHIGQRDLPPDAARSIIGEDKIIGVSVSGLAEAKEAERLGADYLGVGAMYATNTKTDAAVVSFEELTKIRAATNLPLVVIGGINKETIPGFLGTGVGGIAVVSAIIAQTDITAAAREIKELFVKVKARLTNL
ncbi:MAG: thiamine phosphate synthase [Clostridiales bacterium]|nr:thiamine phosphate synthase [Clostridiales bacterium]